MRGAMQWVRPTLRDRLAGWLRPDDRRWTASVAARVVADAMPGLGSGWRTARVTFTSTSMAIATVVHSGSPRRYLVKIPWTVASAASLRQQRTVLANLAREPRLAPLRPLLPRCVGQGEVDGRSYLIEEALPGVCASALMRRPARRRALLEAATAVISDLHARTRSEIVLDRATVREWVDVPLRRIEAAMHTRSRPARLLDAIERLREELTAVLVGRAVHVSWIHGDFWPGNLLAAPPGGRVTGVVDWDCAAPAQLPLHDLLHLHVFAHRLVAGGELGDIVVRALRHGTDRTLAVPPGVVAAWLDTIPPRAALLLYWLRHVLLFIDSKGDHDKPRWVRGNVERVLLNV